MKNDKETKAVKQATMQSLIPGLGQWNNGQKSKAILFFAITILFTVEMILFGGRALVNLITLGTTPGTDNSLFLLIEGTLQLIITALFILFFAINIYDARRVAKMKAEGEHVNTTMKEMMHNTGDKGFPYLLSFPALIIMTFTILFPVLVSLFMAFTNYDFNHIPPAKLIDWVGVQNFFSIFMVESYRATFFNVLSWTVIWTICASTLQISLGIFVAVILNQKFIKGRRFWGVIFLLPWAVPAFVTIMSFSNMFNDSFGAINSQVIPFINRIIPFLHIGAIPWKTDPFWTKFAIIMIQGWLGFPYIYVMVTGVLQSIPGDLYEAARIDGASAIKQFTKITLPMIFAVTAPVFVTQYTGNFNNFSMIYLFSEGGPGSIGGGAGNTDILISWIYKMTTGTSPQYSVAAAVTLIISFITISISLIVFKKTKAFEMED